MAITDKVAAYLSQVGTTIAPALKEAAANSMQQMRAVAVNTGQSATKFMSAAQPSLVATGNTVNQTLTATGNALTSMLAGSPGGQLTSVVQPRYRKGSGGAYVPDTSRGGVPYTAALASQLPTTGMLGAMGMPQAALNMQTAMANPNAARALGAGAIGAGILGAGALGVAAANQMRKKEKERMAGQDLGAQLGVQMPAA